MSKRIPLASEWRLGLDTPVRDRRSVLSLDYPTYQGRPIESNEMRLHPRLVVDEFVVKLGENVREGWLHLERMDHRSWFLGLGEEKIMLVVTREGRIKPGEFYR